jgi:hypothetical protein
MIFPLMTDSGCVLTAFCGASAHLSFIFLNSYLVSSLSSSWIWLWVLGWSWVSEKQRIYFLPLPGNTFSKSRRKAPHSPGHG